MNQQEFSEWVNSRWDGYQNRTGVVNLAIMGLGLGGETGEVYEEIDKCVGDYEDTRDLTLELGDVLHYATAIGGTFKVSTEAKLTEEAFPDLLIHVGQVLEPMKKFIRDGKDPAPKLAVAIPHVIHTVELLARMYGIKPDDVRKANVEKLVARQAAGSLVHGRAVEDERAAA